MDDDSAPLTTAYAAQGDRDVESAEVNMENNLIYGGKYEYESPYDGQLLEDPDARVIKCCGSSVSLRIKSRMFKRWRRGHYILCYTGVFVMLLIGVLLVLYNSSPSTRICSSSRVVSCWYAGPGGCDAFATNFLIDGDVMVEVNNPFFLGLGIDRSQGVIDYKTWKNVGTITVDDAQIPARSTGIVVAHLNIVFDSILSSQGYQLLLDYLQGRMTLNYNISLPVHSGGFTVHKLESGSETVTIGGGKTPSTCTAPLPGPSPTPTPAPLYSIDPVQVSFPFNASVQGVWRAPSDHSQNDWIGLYAEQDCLMTNKCYLAYTPYLSTSLQSGLATLSFGSSKPWPKGDYELRYCTGQYSLLTYTCYAVSRKLSIV